MSRPKYWWYDYVKKLVMHSVGGKAPATLQESISDMAVKKVLTRTKGQYRGDKRLKLIDLVCIKRRYNEGSQYCNHIFVHVEKRPCPPGKNCTERRAKTKNRRRNLIL